MSLNEILEMLSQEAGPDETDAFSLVHLVDNQPHEDGDTYRKDYAKAGRNGPYLSGKKLEKCCLGRGIYD